jgi:hypothetical protein
MTAAATPRLDALNIGCVLSLASRGFRLHPCAPRAKTPLLRDWPTLASCDAEVIRGWAAAHPGCNWGLACGADSCVWVLDVDGDEGKAALQKLIEKYGKLPETLSARTGKGGHLYWSYAESTIRNSASKVGGGLDVRGDGGYVLVPPSVHPSGRWYEWVDPTVPVAEAPQWLVCLAAAEVPSLTRPPASRTIVEIGPGQRHKRLTHVIGRMLNDGMNTAAVEAAAMAENATFAPSKPEADVRKLVADMVGRYVPDESPTRSMPKRADLLTLADVQARAVDWLWQPYLPAGMLAMLSGDPGAGKTYLALAIAAALTIGRVPYSPQKCAPLDVLYMSLENDAACVVRPRFDALGGDATRLHLVRGSVLDVGGAAEHGAVWLTDISVLRDALNKTHARLMVVDPIQSYLGAAVDAHRSNETRPVLDGLARLAEEYRCCVLLLRHLGKAQTGRAIHRGLGSIDLTGAVRCEMLAGCAPDDPQQRAMVQIKNNLGGYGAAVGYVIDETGQFLWTGASALTQSDILAPERIEDTTAKAEAADWLLNYLADGPRPQDEVRKASYDAGFAWATLRRAKKDAGVRSRKCTFSGGWVWEITPAPKREGAHEDVEDARESI